ncbi:hypothetical protein CkaCkLH20_07862 [Colletotrichum karsti]|uniref:Uncharacterized protein n=1 Tax=Colletotrichum karsti TaxID=1095194 RepID=A0A9P6LJD4_9PEZI|nr:uncharacterized protein CkaCkLH20_07862 [Colletotrichum karsti]KAF9874725.1 hypothetical protein CkaCkLH20_07862 [Colletotrichum karsti]
MSQPRIMKVGDQHLLDPEQLNSQFRDTMNKLTHERGFVVVRTAYAADDDADATEWSAALQKLRAWACPTDDNAEMDPDTFALPVIADRETLNGLDYTAVRRAFAGWVESYLRRTLADDDEDDPWPSDVRHDVCIVADGSALASLRNAPERPSAEFMDRGPWVVVLDAQDPANAPYRGGGPYQGWMRAEARALSQLAEDLDDRTLAGGLCPVREYGGQIPLYDGTPAGRLVDPPGGVAGRYRFPRGTPRGVDGAQSMLAEIQRANGGL